MKINVIFSAVVMIAAVAFVAGCASVKTVEPSKAPAITAKYDQGDLLAWGQLMSDAILSHPFPPAGESQPILVDMGIQNRTDSHIDTRAIADTITTKFMDSGKVRVANASRRDELLKEQGYQLANCTEQTRTQIGKQLGAKYMLTGSLVEISEKEAAHVRLSKKQDVYYQLTCEITDLETGLIVLRKQKDRLRTASKPVLGW